MQAGAHWFSFATDAETRKQALDELSFHALMGLAITEPDSGVSIVNGHALFEAVPAAPTKSSSTAAASPAHPPHPALPWFTRLVPRFREWDSKELAAHSSKCGVSYARAFSYQTCMMHAPHYLQWMLRSFLAAGGILRAPESFSILSDVWLSAGEGDVPDAVVNCTGLGGAALSDVPDAAATLQPDRGQTIRIRCPAITEIWRAPNVVSGSMPVYILPRGDGTVILGGTYDRGNASSAHDATIAASILARCSRLLPLLRDARNYEVLGHSSGLRPARRTGNQRIEVDESFAAAAKAKSKSLPPPLVVHCYGHAGDGFQSSWGSAFVVAHLIHQARPKLFETARSFHLQYAQLKTGVMQRATSKDLFAKL